MADNQVNLVVRAVDKVTGPLAAMSKRIDKFTGPLKNISKGFGQLGAASGLTALGGAFKNVGSEIFALGSKLAVMGAAAGFALFKIVRGAVDAGDKLGEMSARVGLSVDTFASLQFAAAQADVEQEAFNASMDQFNKRLGEAKAGGGPLLSFLKEVSPALAKQVKGAKSTEAALSLMTDAFSKISDPGKRAALSAAAFGKGSLQMGVFLAQGSAAIQEQQLQFLRLSGSQEEYARTAGILDNSLREAEIAFLGLGSTIGAKLFPVISKLTERVTAFIVAHRDSISKWAERAADAISRWVDGGGFERLVEWFDKVAAGIAWVVEKLGPMGTFMVAVAVMVAPLIASIVSLGGALFTAGTGLAGFLAPAAPFLLAAAGIAAAGYQIYTNWGDLVFIFKDLGNSIKWAFLDAWEAVKGVVAKLGGFMEILTNPLGAAFKGGKMLFDHTFGADPHPAASAALLGAAAAAPPLRSMQSTEARVSVSFDNLPRGARVSQDPTSTQSVDLNAGYSMVSQ